MYGHIRFCWNDSCGLHSAYLMHHEQGWRAAVRKAADMPSVMLVAHPPGCSTLIPTVYL